MTMKTRLKMKNRSHRCDKDLGLDMDINTLDIKCF